MMEALGYLVAAAPFLVAGAALLGLGWSPAMSGGAGLVVALAGALLWPGFEVSGLPGALVEGFGTIGRVLYVLVGGLLLYNVLAEGGAVDRVSRFLTEVEPDRGALALLVVLGAAPFFESVTGFGVAVVISAPILLSAGFAPLQAAALASWGQLAVPWGALGVGTLIGADLAGLTFEELSDASAWLSLPLFPVYGIATLMLAGGWAGVKRRGFEALYVSLAAGLGVLASSLYLVPELAGAIGGLVAVSAFLLPRAGRLRGLEVPVRALAPYGVLLALLVGANSVGPVRTTLEGLGPAFTGPGLWLLLAAVFAALFLGLDGKATVSAVKRTGKQWLPVAGAIVAFILAGQVVAVCGAAELLAVGAAGAFGVAYPAVSPLVGALGGTMTGSNAGSNALFMPFQAEAAATSGSPELTLAALQNVSGSQSNLLAPQRVVLAATATGLLGREAEIVRAIAPPVAISLAVLILVGAVYG
ncbi:MAG: L-lactate permease [Actinomycetota bacterium]|nr:L-lactate permease [Actinomycetota bacterium]